MTDGTGGPAGWYPQSDGSYRYWDGARWTVTDAEFRSRSADGPTGTAPAAPTAKRRMPAWGWVLTGLGLIVLLCGGLAAFGSTLPPTPDPDLAAQAQATAPAAAAPVAPVPSATTPPGAAVVAGVVATVTYVVDGDTIDTNQGTVRLIGIDTPERGECNYEPATDELSRVLAANGNRVVLVIGAKGDRDKYNRLLRYVDTSAGDDVNLHMIMSGFAIARYDSRDGHGRHPREDAYVAADTTTSGQPACAYQGQSAPAAQPAPLAALPPAQEAPQEQVVPPVVPPAAAAAGAEPWNSPGPDLDCADIGRRVAITGPDYHQLDGDGDGFGCDNYG